jgi:penicillin-binding protein 2
MIEPVPDRRQPLSPQLALRVAMLAVSAFALFAIIFFRLWYLQILSGDQYLKQAQNNRLRLVREVAPRGEILDRHGQPLVQNRQATVIQVTPRSLPDAERTSAALWAQAVTKRLARPKGHRGPGIPIPPIPDHALEQRLKRLARVLGVSAHTIQRRIIQQLGQLPYAPVKVKTAAPASMRNYIRERPELFPGVEVEPVFVRRYPYKTVGAQLVGTIGEVSPSELKSPHFRGVTAGTIVGQEGLEYAYDRYLRGQDGATRYLVDAFGNNKGKTSDRKPIAGHELKLSIDLKLQRVGQTAISRAGGGGKPGAFVALDPRNGQVLAMGSEPSFDPTVLTKPITQAKYDALFGPSAGSPRLNRAIAGQYPTGSTFKVITSMAALTTGVITPDSVIYDGGCIAIGIARTACNAKGISYGPVSLRRALQVSSDVFFYTMGLRTDLPTHPIQAWARKLGLGHKTGIDLLGELPGNVPDPAWRARIGREEAQCEKRRHVPSCGISDKRPWSLGDNVNLAVGQGDLLATPLQMAVVYSTLANDGKVVRPHLGLAVEDQRGRLVRKINPPPARHVKLNQLYRQAILDGLHLAASAPGGTSADVFKGWPQDRLPVYGKTGTAQRPGQADQSWYVCYVASPTRPIVVAVTIERGGFGAQAAAPAARQILSQWFFGRPGKFEAGASTTR